MFPKMRPGGGGWGVVVFREKGAGMKRPNEEGGKIPFVSIFTRR